MSTITAYSGSVPHNYEQYLGPLFFEPYAQDLITHIQKPARHILELACGTGRVTRHLLSRLTTNGQLTATDLNPDMIALAEARIHDARIHWQVADAQKLPFEAQCFELVVCQFGVMFFPEKLQAFNEAFRVLQPGGQFLFNTWDEVKFNTVSWITQEVMDNMLGSGAPKFFEKGPYSFFDKDEIFRLLQTAGFSNIQSDVVQKQSIGFSYDAIAKGIIEGSPLTKFLTESQLSPTLIREKLQERLEAYALENNDIFEMQALVFSAKK